MSMRARLPTLACAALLGVVALGHTGLAEEADLESRVEALEKRVEELAGALEAKDAELERLRELLAEGKEGEEEEEEGERAPGTEPDRPWPFGNDLDEWLEQFQKRGFDWRRDWGLPGRRQDPFRRPRSVPLPGRSRAFLGVELEDLAGGGVRVANVVPRSPAERAGILEGDVLAKVDGRAVSSAGEVVALVMSKEPGDEMAIALLRDGQRVEIEAKLGERSGPGWRGLPRAPSIPSPSTPWAPGWPGASPGTSPGASPGALPGEKAHAGGTAGALDVEVDVPGGTAKVSLSAGGLYLTDDIARELELDEAAREKVEEAFAEARDGLAKAVSELVRDREGIVDAAAISERRLEAERRAREALVGALSPGQIERLELVQARLGSNSRVSVTVQKGTSDGPGEGRRRAPRRRAVPRAAPRGQEPAEPEDGREF